MLAAELFKTTDVLGSKVWWSLFRAIGADMRKLRGKYWSCLTRSLRSAERSLAAAADASVFLHYQ